MGVGSFSKLLLVVENNDEDFEVLDWAFRKIPVEEPVFRCTSGDDALDYLFQSGKYTDPDLAPRPALILLDLNLPGTDGHEVLEQIKQDEKLKTIPVVILTTSSNPKDIESCYKNGANSYVVKPVDFKKFLAEIELFYRYWFEVAQIIQPQWQ